MPQFRAGVVHVSVPATSANLGPGFDSLGLALGLRDTVAVEVIESGLEVIVHGAGADTVPLDERHLVYRAMCRAFEVTGTGPPLLRLVCENVIPHSRGLGSSSAAIVSGLCAARALLEDGAVLSDEAVFSMAVELEGHPDNVAPAFFGGCTIAYDEAGRHRAAAVPVDPRIRTVVFVPPNPVHTTVARGLLPSTVLHADAAMNVGRAALLVAALSGQPELLLAATEDRLHQSYREPVMPETSTFIRQLRADGVPAVLSGAGPSVLAFVTNEEDLEVTGRCPRGWQMLRLPIECAGATIW